MKIVYIARHYPPIISGAARRLQGLVHGLREAGADVFVIAPLLPDGENGLAVPHPQPSPPQPSKIEAPVASPAKDWLREWIRVPDPDVKWCKQAAQAFLASGQRAPDWVFTSAPPESCLIAGAMIKRATGAKWASDFRDAWLLDPRRPLRTNRIRRWIEARWARKHGALLDLGLAVNDHIAAEYRNYTNCPIRTLAHFTFVDHSLPLHLDENKNHLVHTGRFSLSDPNCKIDPLLRAFEKALAARPNLQLHLVGALTREEASKIETSPARAAIAPIGAVPLHQAASYQRAADALILAAADAAPAPPSKVFEYRAADKPIIISGHPGWAASVCGYSDLSAADAMIAAADGKLPLPSFPRPSTYKQAGQTVLSYLRTNSEP